MASTSAELERIWAELAKLAIRRGRLPKRPDRGHQAQEKAALLEGRLEGIEFERSKREAASSTRRTEEVEKKKSNPIKKTVN